MNARPNNWAVICGALRDPVEFKLTLAELVEWRRQGLLEGLVLSTWEDEIDQYAGLRKVLNRLGIVLVESEDVPDPGPSNYWRQLQAFRRGLALCPPDRPVFKARTDKLLGELPTFRDRLAQGPEPTVSLLGQEPLWEHKVHILYQCPTLCFSFLDLAFYGSREALDQMVHLDAFPLVDSLNRNLNPGYSWLAVPWSRRWPAVAEYFRYFNVVELSTTLVTWARKDAPEPLPPYLARIIGLNLVLFGMHCSLPHSDGPETLPGFRDLLGQRIVSPWLKVQTRTKASKSIVTADSLITAALAGDLKDSPDYRAFRKILTGHSSQSWREHFLTDTGDLDAVRAFTLAYGNRREMRSSDLYGQRIPRPPFRYTKEKKRIILEMLGLAEDLGIAPDLQDTILKILEARTHRGAKTEAVFAEIGLAYLTGEAPFPVDRQRAMTWLRRSAERKHPVGQYELARLMLDNPETDEAETEEAVVLVGRAAERMHPEAVLLWGDWLFRGIHMPADRRAARKLLKRSAGKGNKAAVQLLRQHDAEKVS